MVDSKSNDTKTKLMKSQVMSLDIANHCGFYIPNLGWGTFDLTENRKNGFKQHLRFYDQLVKWITENDIKLVVAEDFTVFAGGQIISIKKLCEYRGILLLVCDQLGLPEPVFINCKDAKRWVSGNGNADKQLVMSMLKKRFGIDTHGDDNAADAIVFWLMYVKRFHLE